MVGVVLLLVLAGRRVEGVCIGSSREVLMGLVKAMVMLMEPMRLSKPFPCSPLQEISTAMTLDI